jgi:fucose 4-O-acetylase-like acetyltransferase
MRYDLSFFKLGKTKLIAFLLLALFLVFTLNYAINLSSELPMYYHHGIDFFLWVILFLGLYAIVVDKIEEVAGNFFIFNWIKWLGKNVTYIYIIQWLIIGNIATEIYKSISSPSLLAASYIGVLGASVLITFLIEKVIIGKFRKS